MSPLPLAILFALSTYNFQLTTYNFAAAEEVKPSTDALDNVVESVEFYDTPITDILRLLARQNDLNLIIGPDSMGNISLRFSGVTLKAALDAILRAKGFQYQLYDNIMLVNRPDSLEKLRGIGLESKMFKLKNSDARDIKAAIDSARVLSPWVFTSVFSRAINLETSAAAFGGTSAGASAGTSSQTASRTNIAQRARSDVLLVTDLRKNLEDIAALINSIDTPVRQIAIDVKFVETILSEDQQIGINWQQLLKMRGAYKGKTDWLLGKADPTGISTGEIAFGSLTQTHFELILDMLMQNQRAKLLSQPRIATMDNQPARIAISTTVYIESRSSDPATGAIQSNFEPLDVPIEMVVVPHILEGDRVLLSIKPIVSEIIGWQVGAQGQRVPQISSRTADTRIEVKNGETAIIGGLLKDKKIQIQKRVWLLGSIPLIGYLFRHNIETLERSDLSIFITPRIVAENAPSPFEEPQDHYTTLADSVEKPAPAEIETSAGPAVQLPEIVDLHSYFPLPSGARWTYDWVEAQGDKWISDMFISKRDGELAYSVETIPDGKYKSLSRSCYKWDSVGLVNFYKVNPGRDSLTYSPARYILPAQMEIGREYETGYTWTTYGIAGQRISVGRVNQRQKIVSREGVTLPYGRYRDCIRVETLWWNPDDKSKAKKKKLVWYARDVGPVKVEHDIDPDISTQKGKMSAVLTKR